VISHFIVINASRTVVSMKGRCYDVSCGRRDRNMRLGSTATLVLGQSQQLSHVEKNRPSVK